MTSFYKLSGAGNDFIALVEPTTPEGAVTAPSADEIRAWCRRGLSLGADGLFLLARTGPAAARMSYFNADGGAAALCLNGTRCAARLAFELGWADGGAAVTVETGAGRHRARRLSDTEVEVEVPPLARPPEPRELAVERRRLRGWTVSVGVPHLVLEWPEELAQAPVASLGPLLRRHPDLGPEGANVDFVRFDRPAAGRGGRIAVRSYERGVEAETLACGTGVLAAAAVALAGGRAGLPIEATTRGGFVLTVGGEAGAGGRPGSWSLAGDARIVARGTLEREAAALPAPECLRG